MRHRLRFNFLEDWSDSDNRMTTEKIHLNGKRITLLSIYVPNDLDKEFYKLLTKTLLDLTDLPSIDWTDPPLLKIGNEH